MVVRSTLVKELVAALLSTSRSLKSSPRLTATRCGRDAGRPSRKRVPLGRVAYPSGGSSLNSREAFT